MSLTLHLGANGAIEIEVPSQGGASHRVTVRDDILAEVVRQILQAQASGTVPLIGTKAAPTQWDLEQQFIKRLPPRDRRISSAPKGGNITLEDLGL